LDEDSTFSFPVGEDLDIRVVGEVFDYRGILIRLEADQGVDTSGALIPTTDGTQAANVCSDPVQGITHRNSVLKNNQGGIIRLDEPTSLSLDVTIVVSNNNTNSRFYYSRFLLEAVQSPPTSNPTDKPTFAPSPSQTTSTSSPTDVCIPSGQVCRIGEECCGSNVCVGICTRGIKIADKDANKDQFIIGSGGRARGAARRSLLKGSRPNKK
jgi:hypothetical protein